MVDQGEKNKTEVRMGNQIGEKIDMGLVQEWKRIDEKLQFVDEKVMQIYWTPEVKLREPSTLTSSLCVNRITTWGVTSFLLPRNINILKVAKISHDFKISTPCPLIHKATAQVTIERPCLFKSIHQVDWASWYFQLHIHKAFHKDSEALLVLFGFQCVLVNHTNDCLSKHILINEVTRKCH